MSHTVSGIPVFWFSAPQSVAYGFAAVSKLCVPGLEQISAETESSHLDTQ